jgi:N-methylhydantoinase B
MQVRIMKLDSIELEVIKSRLEEAALTMENQLFHSGYSPILRESADGSAAILDKSGGVVVATGLPVHLFPYYHTVRAVLKLVGDRMQPGDSFLINDPYLAGTLHVPDTAIVTPFFHEGKLAAFCASIAHKPDMGGLVIGSSSAGAREIYHDGLLFPGVRYWTAQGPNPDFEAMLRSNTRSPEEAIGDLRAQVGCTRIGCTRLKEQFDRYGTEVMTHAFEELILASERRMRQKLAAIADGTAQAEAMLDHDGVDVDKPIAFRVKIVKQGGNIIIDFSNSDPQTTGPVNLRPQAAESGAAIGLIAMLDPDIPINDGCRRVIEFINPPGRITNAVKPRPINNYYPSLHLVYCVTQKALAQLAPQKAVAPAGLGVGGFAIGYQQTRNGKPGALYELIATSLGGTSEVDGSFLVLPVAQITPTQPIEILETEYPVEVMRFEPLVDTAGPGRNRGGPGYLREYRLLQDAMVTVRMGQFAHGAWGVVGGEAPNLARCVLNAGTESEERLPIMVTRQLKAGDTLSITVAGGGGYGAPTERARERVASDVRDGLVSVDAARARYRVVIDPTDGTVNNAATNALRARG